MLNIFKVSLVSAFSILCGFSQFSHAQFQQSTPLAVDWTERIPDGAGLSPHDFNLMGDNINLQTGEITFEYTDVSIPGNSQLDVSVRRRLDPSQWANNEFGNWQLEFPALQIKYPNQAGHPYSQEENTANFVWGNNRCSGNLEEALPNWWNNITQRWETPFNYSDGVVLQIPGESSQVLLNSPNGSSWPDEAQKVTVNGWYFTCIANADGHGGEGFYGFAPDGRRYKFDTRVLRQSVSGGTQWSVLVTPHAPPAPRSHQTYSSRMMLAASEVTDQFGNKVVYVYDARGRLTDIEANDGRKISLSYIGTSVRISEVTANPNTLDARSWSYSYDVDVFPTVPEVSTPRQVQALNRVTLPDGRFWEFELGALSVTPVNGGGCHQLDQTAWIKHPDGTRAEYVLQEIEFNTGLRAPFGGPVCPGSTVESAITFSSIMAVTERRLIVFPREDNPDHVWRYNYSSRFVDGFERNRSEVTRPDGALEVSEFTVPTGTGGSLLRTQQIFEDQHASSPMQSIEYTYLQESEAGQNYLSVRTDTSFRPYRQRSVSLTVEGETYQNVIDYNVDRNSSDYSYGRPVRSEQYSTLSTEKRIFEYSYAHNIENWILGLRESFEMNGKEIERYFYNSLGQVVQFNQFGVPYTYYSYNNDGTSHTSTDAIGRVTRYSDWYRGVPRRVDDAFGTEIQTSSTLTLDANGWVLSKTTPKGDVTAYEYNQVGRVIRIDNPAPLADSSVSYTYSNGGLVQEIERGSHKLSTWMDSQLRPHRITMSSSDSSAQTVYMQTRYDEMGRASFESFKTHDTFSDNGKTTEFDALGRVVTVTENVAPFAQLTMEYLSRNRTKVTDANGNVKVTAFSGYSSPDDGDVLWIQQEEGILTEMEYDVFGNLLRATQSGNSGGFNVSSTNHYYYDNSFRICREVIPEQGNRLFVYDLAGQNTAFTRGAVSGSGCATSIAPHAAITNTFNELGQLVAIDYPDDTPDVTYQYDDNGNKTRIERGDSVWTYQYDVANKLIEETLEIDGFSYSTVNEFNDLEVLTHKIMPSGQRLSYAPNGLGQTSQIVSDQHGVLVDQIRYHANDLISGFGYGNGVTRLVSLDSRQQISHLSDRSPNGDMVWLDYTHDANGNVISIIDQASPTNQDRYFSYDGVNRLTSAFGPWGIGSFQYDALGNIRKKILGDRTVELQYDSKNRLSQFRDSTAGGNRWQSVVHDKYGNVIRNGDTSLKAVNLTFDAANQPVNVSRLANRHMVLNAMYPVVVPLGQVDADYSYDGNRKRVKRVVDGQTTYAFYSLSGSLLFEHNVTNNVQTDYIRLADQTVARIQNNATTYLHNDLLGTAIAATDVNGNLMWRKDYTPFGEARQSDSQSQTAEGFAGHIRDAETGLNYMKARFYDPVLGRFLSTDPKSFLASSRSPSYFNRYAYTSNNPVIFKDATGECTTLANGQLVGICAARPNAQPLIDEFLSNENTDGASTNASFVEAGITIFVAIQGVNLNHESVLGGNFLLKTENVGVVSISPVPVRVEGKSGRRKATRVLTDLETLVHEITHPVLTLLGGFDIKGPVQEEIATATANAFRKAEGIKFKRIGRNAEPAPGAMKGTTEKEKRRRNETTLQRLREQGIFNSSDNNFENQQLQFKFELVFG